MPIALFAYGAGVLIGLWRVDGPPATKLALALLWPIGAAAFFVTVTILLLASLVAFPLVAAAAAGAGVVWWILR